MGWELRLEEWNEESILLCDEVSEKISVKKKIEGEETQGGAPQIKKKNFFF